MKHYDALVIGFGKGGKTLAGALAGAGWKVAVAEQSDQMYGGTCINVGCIPSKSLVHSAAQSKRAGGDWAEQSERYRVAIEEKRRLTAIALNKVRGFHAARQRFKTQSTGPRKKIQRAFARKGA